MAKETERDEAHVNTENNVSEGAPAEAENKPEDTANTEKSEGEKSEGEAVDTEGEGKADEGDKADAEEAG